MNYYNLYFSPTGGTKKVADIVAEGWKETFVSIDMMQTIEPQVFNPGDLCLFSVPSYGGRVPSVVINKIKELSGNGAMAVLIAVFGNRAIDDTLLELSDELSKVGFRCVAAMEAVAQHSLLPQFGAGRPDTCDKNELHRYVEKIKTSIQNNTLSTELKLPGNHPYKQYNGVPLKPVATSSCVNCGICAAQCPVGAISLKDGHITDKDKCISCMHCVAICPHHARKTNKLMTFVAAHTMKKSCSSRKNNKLYL